jgi:engulfment and cell motility protein 1
LINANHYLKVDLSVVSSVVSNVSASPPSSSASNTTVKSLNAKTGGAVGGTDTHAQKPSTSTKITIHGILPPGSSHAPSSPVPNSPSGQSKESILLTLHPQTHTAASEWLDGLLMLLNQKPITAETTKLINLIGSYGLKIRLLNIRYEDLNSNEARVPGREALDDDYYYDFGEAAA